MDLKFKVAARIAKPVAEVFEAVVNPDQLSRYFTTGGAKGRLETGTTVYWAFDDYPVSFPVSVVEVVKDKRIVFRWEANEGTPDTCTDPIVAAGYSTTVTMEFEALDDGKRTVVTIAEQGWRPTDAGLQGSYGNCQGWTQALCAMKAYLEYGINIRDGMYK